MEEEELASVAQITALTSGPELGWVDFDFDDPYMTHLTHFVS